MDYLKKKDITIHNLILKETKRQEDCLTLIASENFTSPAVLEAQGSILTNKYAEGYPDKRYYNGCYFVDEIEKIAISRAQQLFNVKYVNVQPHSGTQANMAVLQALLKPNDVILGMSLDAGGHLSHGSILSFSGIFFRSFSYSVSPETEILDYENILKIAYQVKPKLIIAGASAYSRKIDFVKFRQIADKVNAYLMADIAHIAGLIVSRLHPCPLLAKADVVTSTTHKTLRGPRGGIILTNSLEINNKINKGIFPGTQGGPFMHIIAAKAVAFKEALTNDFILYQQQVVKNSLCLTNCLISLGYRVISGTTENHLLTVDVTYNNPQLNGKIAADILQKINIIVNKNFIPFDKKKGFYPSGIRLGTAAMTTRGFKEKEFIQIAYMINRALKNYQNEIILAQIKKEVLTLIAKYPLYY
ncbi:serine hydroxymethyltransferase ['Crotalaria aegyptiaca' phytoplasma]|uniref:Serine hydroxymethyltransferase n=1 Tax=Candidatus Phytoplasma crotalariae TaxID=2982627 RepID=A0ABT9D5D9_9MOLU|nr:serine hydroxymethyltransferase ['Crotalaria aegyptiaca' phytoplasma]MDO8059238.1 serine hydroxymethyltransferase ['Crotalaria aegyptiaca' phytoplasma]